MHLIDPPFNSAPTYGFPRRFIEWERAFRPIEAVRSSPVSTPIPADCGTDACSILVLCGIGRSTPVTPEGRRGAEVRAFSPEFGASALARHPLRRVRYTHARILSLASCRARPHSITSVYHLTRESRGRPDPDAATGLQRRQTSSGTSTTSPAGTADAFASRLAPASALSRHSIEQTISNFQCRTLSIRSAKAALGDARHGIRTRRAVAESIEQPPSHAETGAAASSIQSPSRRKLSRT